GDFGVERLDQRVEAGQRVARPRLQRAGLLHPPRGLPQRHALAAGQPPHLVEGALADATRGRVARALEGRVVAAVGDQAQVRQRVLDLGALEEAHAAVHAVGNLLGEQRFLERTRLGVAAVEDRAVAVAAAAL